MRFYCLFFYVLAASMIFVSTSDARKLEPVTKKQSAFPASVERGKPDSLNLAEQGSLPKTFGVTGRSPTPLEQCAETVRSYWRTIASFGKAQIDDLLRSDPALQEVIRKCSPPLEKIDFFHGMDFVGAKLGWVVGWNGRILHTQDGGGTWQAQDSGLTGVGGSLLAVKFLDPHIGYAAGFGGAVLRTVDGGAHWVRTTNAGNDKLMALSCAGPETCWVAGETFGNVYATKDGGATWNALKTPSLSAIHSLQFIEGWGWASTSDGEVLRTNNRGATWTTIFSQPRTTLWALHFVDRFNGWVVGDAGTILRTRDGGDSWEDQTGHLEIGKNINRNDIRFHAVRFVDPRQGWVAGLLGTIIHTTDGGATWQGQLHVGINSATIYSFRALSPNVALASGNLGSIIATTDGGKSWFPTYGAEFETLKAIALYLRERAAKSEQQLH